MSILPCYYGLFGPYFIRIAYFDKSLAADVIDLFTTGYTEVGGRGGDKEYLVDYVG